MIDDCVGTVVAVIFVVAALLVTWGVAGVSVEQKSLKEEICVSTQAQVADYLVCKQMSFNDIIKRMEVKLENSKE